MKKNRQDRYIVTVDQIYFHERRTDRQANRWLDIQTDGQIATTSDDII